MLYSHPTYKDCKANLRDLSKDESNDEYMTDINVIVTKFDCVKDKFVEANHINSPSSVDALYKYGDVYYLIEFKNQKEESVDKYELHKKLYDSVIILSHIYNISMSKIKEKCIYIVVYSKEKNKNINVNGKQDIENSENYNNLKETAKKHNKNIISFGLSIYKGFLCKKIYTLTKEEFNYNFQEHLNTNKDLISILKDRKKKDKA